MTSSSDWTVVTSQRLVSIMASRSRVSNPVSVFTLVVATMAVLASMQVQKTEARVHDWKFQVKTEDPVNETVHLLAGSAFTHSWKVQIEGVASEKKPRLYFKNPKLLIVKHDKSINKREREDYPFVVIPHSSISTTDVCEGAYFDIIADENQLSSRKVYHIKFFIDNVTPNCSGMFIVKIAEGSEVLLLLDLTIKVYVAAKFEQELSFMFQNDPLQMVNFETLAVGIPKPTITWTCKRPGERGESFEMKNFRNREEISLSIDYLPYKSCSQIETKASNNVCIGYIPNLNCTERVSTLTAVNAPVNAFSPRTNCQQPPMECARIFNSRLVSSNLQRDVIGKLRQALEKWRGEISPLCEEFVKNFTCSYAYTSEFCPSSSFIATRKTEKYSSGYCCSKNYNLLKANCPRNLLADLSMDYNLVAANCENTFSFADNFPPSTCTPLSQTNWRYTGALNHTSYGRQCVDWNKVSSRYINKLDQQFLFKPTYNFCRHVYKYNLTHPGCFVTTLKEGLLSFQICNVETCAMRSEYNLYEEDGTPDNHQMVKKERPMSSNIQMVMIISISVALVLCVVG